MVAGEGGPLPGACRRPTPKSTVHFERALRLHEQTPDAFEKARTQLAYGERLRRARNRVLAREQLRDALEAFERLDARPWAERARSRARGDWGDAAAARSQHGRRAHARRSFRSRCCSPSGKTTRETAAALFLSPKTIEYHLRHVYQKLDIHSREELARALAERADDAGERTTELVS